MYRSFLFIATCVLFANIYSMSPADQNKEYTQRLAELEKKLKEFELANAAEIAKQNPFEFLKKISNKAFALRYALVAYTDCYFEHFSRACPHDTKHMTKLAQYSIGVALKDFISYTTELISKLALAEPVKPECLDLAIKSIPDLKLRYFANAKGEPALDIPPLSTSRVVTDSTCIYKKEMLDLLAGYQRRLGQQRTHDV